MFGEVFLVWRRVLSGKSFYYILTQTYSQKGEPSMTTFPFGLEELERVAHHMHFERELVQSAAAGLLVSESTEVVFEGEQDIFREEEGVGEIRLGDRSGIFRLKLSGNRVCIERLA